MSRVQTQANEMMDHHGFLGVPRETFEAGGRAQFIRLLEHGLNPEAKILDIGCGCLRGAYWLVRFLDPEGYCGIEPASQRLEYGRRYLFSEDLLGQKRPRFDENPDFDTSVFGIEFDYFFAYSIWTHCGKNHIETMLDGFVQNTGPNGVFLVSYLPAKGPEDDYLGKTWVGTSHESDTPGIVFHSLDWIREACQKRGLRMETISTETDFDGQYWMRIDKS